MRVPIYTGVRMLEDALKGESVTKHLWRLRKMKKADEEFIRDYQFQSVKKLIAYAYENTEFYNKRFTEQGVEPEQIKSWEDFEQLKPVTREDMQERGLEILSKEFSRDSLLSGRSSGSTGQPITFYHDRRAYSAGRAAVLLGWELAGMKLGDKMITLWGNRDTVESEWATPGSRFKAMLYRNKRFPVDKFIEESYFQEILDVLVKQKEGFIFGYTQTIYMLACYAKERGIKLKRKFDGVLTTAEKLYPGQREIIEEALGPVFDGYGSREILGKAYQCQERKGYHIIEPNVIFEKSDYKEDTKEVIVTDLWNYAWPLIRYNIGDLIAGEFVRCGCGCTWKTFDTIIGRRNELMRMPNGGFLTPLFWLVEDIMKHYSKAKQRQVARVSENKIVFRVQLFKDQDSSFVENLREAVAKRFKGIIDTDVEVVESFPLGPSGKHKSMVDERLPSPR